MAATIKDSLFSIGEFSRISGLIVKALRFYHEQGLLEPAFVDTQTGYRYYGQEQIDEARIIVALRGVDLPVKQVQGILARRREQGGGEGWVEELARHEQALESKIKEYRQAVRLLRVYLAAERQEIHMDTLATQVQEKVIEPMVVAGIRMKGRYDECGKAFAKLCRGARSAVGGPPMMLHFDDDYKESDADFEACIPLKKSRPVAGAQVHELAGGKAVALVHKGPYEQIGASYAHILKYIKKHGYTTGVPSREVYLKGPGMIFRGNPKNYLTEIQFIVGAGGAGA